MDLTPDTVHKKILSRKLSDLCAVYTIGAYKKALAANQFAENHEVLFVKKNIKVGSDNAIYNKAGDSFVLVGPKDEILYTSFILNSAYGVSLLQRNAMPLTLNALKSYEIRYSEQVEYACCALAVIIDILRRLNDKADEGHTSLDDEINLFTHIRDIITWEIYDIELFEREDVSVLTAWIQLICDKAHILEEDKIDKFAYVVNLIAELFVPGNPVLVNLNRARSIFVN